MKKLPLILLISLLSILSPLNVVVNAQTTTPTKQIKLTDVQFPLIFRSSSDTTVPTKVPAAQQKNYTGLTFDINSFGTIKYTGPVDLTNQELLSTFNTLDKYVQIGRGFIQIDTTKLVQLKDVPATISFRGLSLTEGKYTILKDGKDASNDISNMKYDSGSKILTFDAKNVTKYEVKVTDDTIARDKENEKKVDRRIQIGLAVLVGLILVLGLIMGFLFYEMKSKKNY